MAEGFRPVQPKGLVTDARGMVTETVRMRDSMTAEQRFAACMDVMRQCLTELAVDEYHTPRLTWAPRSWLSWWRDRWTDGFQPHTSCYRMRSKAARALDEVAEIVGQPWRALHRVTPVRPQFSPYRRRDGQIARDG